jgi:hypothetical protein
MAGGRLIVLASAVLVAVELAPVPAAAQGADPGAVVAAFYAASNARDLSAAQALVRADTVFTFAVGNPMRPEGVQYVGPTGLAERFDIQASEDVVDQISDVHAADNRVTWTDLHANNGFRRLGVSPLEFRGEAVVENGKLVSLTTTFSPAAVQRLRSAQTTTAPAQTPRALPRTGDEPAGGLVAGASAGLGVGFLLLGLALRWPRAAS